MDYGEREIQRRLIFYCSHMNRDAGFFRKGTNLPSRAKTQAIT